MTIEAFETIVVELSALYPDIVTEEAISRHYNAPEASPQIMAIPDMGSGETDAMYARGFHKEWSDSARSRSRLFVWGVVRTNEDGTLYPMVVPPIAAPDTSELMSDFNTS